MLDEVLFREPDEGVLRKYAREVIRTGKLPARPPDRIWGGPGAGDSCTLCGQSTERDEITFEIHFIVEGNVPGLDKFDLHAPCFAAWESERPSPNDPR